MTLAVMRHFGLQPSNHQYRQFNIEPDRYQARDYAIEPDASAASYFFAAAAITGGSVTVAGPRHPQPPGRRRLRRRAGPHGLPGRAQGQPDHRHRRPTLQGVDVDMNPISDTVMTLAVVALFAEGPPASATSPTSATRKPTASPPSPRTPQARRQRPRASLTAW